MFDQRVTLHKGCLALSSRHRRQRSHLFAYCLRCSQPKATVTKYIHFTTQRRKNGPAVEPLTKSLQGYQLSYYRPGA